MANDLAKLQRSTRDVAKWQKAQQLVVKGNHHQALPAYRDLVQRFPNVAQLWFEQGMAATGDLEFGLALTAFTKAQELAFDDSSFQVLLGQQFHRLRRQVQARACFEQAVRSDPSSVHARLSLAAWYERERRLDAATDAVEACLAKHPGHPQALCVKALLLHRSHRDTEAETLLMDLIRTDCADPNVKVSSRHLLGTVVDQLGRHSEAIKWLVESKNILRQSANVDKMGRDYDQADRERRALLAGLTPEIIRKWQTPQNRPGPCKGLVFLGGHPRSGTTLLEQILDAHPEIHAFDESEAFVQEIWQKLAPLPPGRAFSLQQVDNLGELERAGMRERYFKSLFRELDEEPAGLILVDKNPSPTTALHLWLRIFPGLKVLTALRDPRDVIISCFFQNLMLTPANANFLSLERTAKHYSDLMEVWLRMRELGGFDWLESRYEDLVANPEGEGRRITEFCGLPWHEQQANHHEVARNKLLFAPTFSDVAQPVHKRAVGRWHKYAEALQPIQERVRPYCLAFGYEV
ncbi:MAG TPA: sulfotransferase [Verrucomicrobiae bacterium]|nr:sulfotransferase [Verrucomicrobiae bacterium]